MTIVRKLLKLWALYARMDLIWVLRDMKTFLMCMITDSVINIATITGMWLLAERFNGIGHWSRPQVLFLLGYGAVVTGLVETFFGFNIAFISRRVGRGQMDHTLIQPQPLWLSLLTEGFVPFAGGAILLPGAVLLAWAIHALRLTPSSVWLLLLGISLFSSLTVVLAFQFLWGSLAFWAPRSAEEVSSSTMRLITQLKTFPLDGLSTALTGGLLTVLPIGFVAWYPSSALLGLRPEPWRIWVTPAAALCFAVLTVAVFRKGLVYYGRTGSQRYLGWGHRG